MSDEFKREIDAVLSEGDPEEVLGVVIEIALAGEDASWSQERLLDLAQHENTDVRGTALIALAHLVERCEGLDMPRIEAAIERGMRDEKQFVREQAEAARDAISGG